MNLQEIGEKGFIFFIMLAILTIPFSIGFMIVWIITSNDIVAVANGMFFVIMAYIMLEL